MITMSKMFLLILLSFFLAGCNAKGKEPTFFYRAAFDPLMINDVEVYIRAVGKKWDLEIFEKDRDQMKFITQNQEAFYIAFYYNDNAILHISNAGFGVGIVLSLFDDGEMPLSDLKKLDEEIRAGLKENFGVKLEARDP